MQYSYIKQERCHTQLVCAQAMNRTTPERGEGRSGCALMFELKHQSNSLCAVEQQQQKKWVMHSTQGSEVAILYLLTRWRRRKMPKIIRQAGGIITIGIPVAAVMMMPIRTATM